MKSSEQKAREMVGELHSKIDRVLEHRVEGAKKAKSSESIRELARHTRKLAKVVREEGAVEARKIRKAVKEIEGIAKEKKKEEPKKKRGPKAKKEEK